MEIFVKLENIDCFNSFLKKVTQPLRMYLLDIVHNTLKLNVLLFYSVQLEFSENVPRF